MPNVIISDTSCLIILNKIGELDLLQKIYGKVSITQTISLEYGKKLPNWVIIKTVKNDKTTKLLEMQVDRGEASVIALALRNNNSVLILDDWKARRFAERLGITVTGTLGVIIKAKNIGIIPSIKPFLSKIRKTNFRISKELENTALREANEKND